MGSENWKRQYKDCDKGVLAKCLQVNEAELELIHEIPGHEVVIRFAIEAGISFEVAAAQYVEGAALVADSKARWFEIFAWLHERTKFGKDHDLFG